MYSLWAYFALNPLDTLRSLWAGRSLNSVTSSRDDKPKLYRALGPQVCHARRATRNSIGHPSHGNGRRHTVNAIAPGGTLWAYGSINSICPRRTLRSYRAINSIAPCRALHSIRPVGSCRTCRASSAVNAV